MYFNQTPPQSSHIQSPQMHRELYVMKVTGEGRISVTPDRAIVTLGAITERTNLSAAQTENAQTISRIIESLVTMGIPRESIKTVEYRIEPQYDYQDGKQTFRGYRVTHLLQIIISDIEQTGRVVDTAVSQGANSVSSIRFTVAHPEAYYNQALSIALTNSQQKAQTLARTMGVTLQRVPLRILEGVSTARPVPYEAPLYARSAPATPIEPGQLEITAFVTADYQYFG